MEWEISPGIAAATFRNNLTLCIWCAILWSWWSCAQPEDSLSLDALAERYIKLTLEIGNYDPDFVDAYYGPQEWIPEKSKVDTLSLGLIESVEKLVHDLEICPIPNETEEIARYQYLYKQTRAVLTKVRMLNGEDYSFDEEAELLYDIAPPQHPLSYFDELLKELDRLIPGEGDLHSRYLKFSSDFIVPVEKLDTVFQAAIFEARSRTKRHFTLPDAENFQLEYVKGKTWSGYNYYKGNSYSLIQINTDLPIYIERAIDLACHEGYPGHHVYNALLEKNLVTDKGWLEFSIYPLFSPQSFIAEGSANYGIELAFPRNEKTEFEKKVLYPLAGLDSSQADLYNEVQKLRGELQYVGNEAARLYLNGEISREEAAQILERYLFYEPDRALQRTRFIDQYRSYVINYNLGQDVVADFVRREAGMDHEKRWQVFEFLLSHPVTASMITNN